MIDLSLIDPDLERTEGATPGADGAWALDWALDGDGLEHRGTGYFIARDALAARRGDGLWEWPLQLAEKSWCAPRAFREAFLAALDRFGIARDEHLARSFAIGFGMRMGSGGGQTGFVALGDLVRPQPVRPKSVERKRPAAAEPRAAARGRIPADRARVPVGARA